MEWMYIPLTGGLLIGVRKAGPNRAGSLAGVDGHGG